MPRRDDYSDNEDGERIGLAGRMIEKLLGPLDEPRRFYRAVVAAMKAFRLSLVEQSKGTDDA